MVSPMALTREDATVLSLALQEESSVCCRIHWRWRIWDGFVAPRSIVYAAAAFKEEHEADVMLPRQMKYLPSPPS